MRHITDSERLINSKLNRTESELKQAKQIIHTYQIQLDNLKYYISELKETNKILTNQVRYLVEKKQKEGSIA